MIQKRLGPHCGWEGEVYPFGEPLSSLLEGVSMNRLFADDLRKMQSMQSPAFGPVPPVPRVVPLEGRTQKFTSNPNEVNTTRTTPSASEVVTLLKSASKELTEEGARTLTAQFMHETAGGKSCWNWNLGNVKALQPNVPHMYLHHVNEIDTPDVMNKLVIDANKISPGLGHIASDEEIQKNKWHHSQDTVVGVFEPPSIPTRFRAYSSLLEGSQKWLDFHKKYITLHKEYLLAVNAGDCISVAHLLKVYHYYTGDEHDYGKGMVRYKKQIDATLGATK